MQNESWQNYMAHNYEANVAYIQLMFVGINFAPVYAIFHIWLSDEYHFFLLGYSENSESYDTIIARGMLGQ